MQVKSIAECSKRSPQHSAILSTFIKLAFVIKIFVLSIFEWPLTTGIFEWLLKTGLFEWLLKTGIFAWPT